MKASPNHPEKNRVLPEGVKLVPSNATRWQHHPVHIYCATKLQNDICRAAPGWTDLYERHMSCCGWKELRSEFPEFYHNLCKIC